MSLFRKEAIQAKRHGLESRILIVQTPGLALFTLLAGVVLAVVLIFGIFGEFTNRVPVVGALVPEVGIQRVFSPAPGIVAKRFFNEGQVVKKNDVLYTIVAERYTGQQKGVEALVAAFADARRKSVSAELQNVDALEASERRTLTSTQRELQHQLETITDQILRQKIRVTIAANARKRYLDLLPQGYVTTDQVQDREAAYLDQVSALDNLQREKSGILKDLRSTESNLAALQAKFRGQREQLHRTDVAAEQDALESNARREIHILAPMSGVASGVPASEGEAVDTTKPLITIVPDDDQLIAELYVPRSAIGFMQIGADVYLRYDAFPYEKYGLQPGRILSISRTAIPSSELATAFGGVPRRNEETTLESYYRLMVKLPSSTIEAYGRPHKLRPGMTLTADVELEKKKLYEWLLDPVISSKGRLVLF